MLYSKAFTLVLLLVLSRAPSLQGDHAGILWMHGGHTRDVVEIKLSDNAFWLASACADGSVKVWSRDDGQFRKSLFGNTNRITAMGLSLDGTKVVAAVNTGELVLWEVATGDILRRWQAHPSVKSLDLSPDGTLIAAGSGETGTPTIKLWRLTDGVLLNTFVGHAAPVTMVTFTHDGEKLISTSLDRSIRQWNIASGQLQKTVQTTHAILTGALLHDSDFFLYPGPVTMRRYDLPEWTAIAAFPMSIRNVQKVVCSPWHHVGDGQAVAAASSGGLAASWFALSGGYEQIYPVNSFEGLGVQAIAFGTLNEDHFASELYTGGSDRTLKEWTLRGEMTRQFGFLRSAVNVVQFQPNTDRLAVGGEHSLSLLRRDGLHFYTLSQPNLTAAAFSPEGTLLVTADADEKLRLWRSTDGQLIHTLGFHTEPLNDVAYAPHGQQFASASADQTIRIWNTNAASPARTLTGSPSSIERITYTPDGGTIISGDREGMLRWWRTADGQQTNSIKAHDRWITEVRISPDGKLLASCSMYDTTLRLWPLYGGSVDRTISAEFPIVSCAFSPEGSMIAGSIRDPENPWLTGEVRVWRVADGTVVRSFTKETLRAGRLAWSKLNSLAVGRLDGVAVVLNLDRTTPPPVVSASFLPESQRMRFHVTAEVGATLRIKRTTDFNHWSVWTNVLATGTQQVLEYPIPLSGREFFRAVAE